MRTYRILSELLLSSNLFLALGALILRLENLVPSLLTISTIAVILLIFVVAHFVWKKSFTWATIGVILAAVSIVFNTLQPQHLDAIAHPFVSLSFTVLVASDILGFYILPISYLIVYLLRFKSLKD